MKTKEELIDEAGKLAIDLFGYYGRLISQSKTRYRERYPDHLIVFNSNLCTKEYGKFWFGDIDVTKDRDKLENLADTLKISIYVLYETDARFEFENNPQFDKAVYIAGAKYGNV